MGTFILHPTKLFISGVWFLGGRESSCVCKSASFLFYAILFFSFQMQVLGSVGDKTPDSQICYVNEEGTCSMNNGRIHINTEFGVNICFSISGPGLDWTTGHIKVNLTWWCKQSWQIILLCYLCKNITVHYKTLREKRKSKKNKQRVEKK
ncbi:hypothetical protein AMECASPLE_019106 [Ameca splendens]|uniref:Uncharacterized protein n=1 Tax=Ameca splendens TaxID=208324 RepID=A0ABV0Z1K3_9TELE